MSGATIDVTNGDLSCPLSNGNAIITGSNFAVSYIDETGPADMHAIRVWAITWRSYCEVVGCKVVAINNVRVERFAIQGSYIMNYGIVHFHEFN